MNGTSGFPKVRSSPPDHHFLHKQQPQFEAGSRRLLRTRELPRMAPRARTKNCLLPSSQNPIPSYTSIITKQENIPDTNFHVHKNDGGG